MSVDKAAAWKAAPAGRIEKLTKNDVTVFEVTAALCCGTAGTVNFLDAYGNDCVNYPLQVGYNPINITCLKTGGSADDIWALRH